MKRILLALTISTLLAPAFGMNISIPSLTIATRIFGYDNSLVTQTQTEMDMLIEGGYKFGGKIVFGFDGFVNFTGSPLVGQTMPILSFKSVSVVVRNLAESPLNLSFFVGADDYLGYGNDFSRLFGAGNIESTYRATYQDPLTGFEYEYRGIHRVNGTGIKLEYQSPDLPVGFMWYVYQDQNFVESRPAIDAGPTAIVNLNVLFFYTNIYSTDVRFMFNSETIKAEVFGGYTVDTSNLSGYARCGALFYLNFGVGDLLIEAGLPQIGFGPPIGLDLLYALVEGRFYLGPLTLIPTVFMRPAIYLQEVKNLDENGKIDFNLNFAIFNPRKDLVSFGVEGNFATTDLFFGNFQYDLFVRPYIAFATPGVFWELKLSMKVLDSVDAMTMNSFLSSFTGMITVKAQF